MNALSGALATYAANGWNNIAATDLYWGESESNVIHSEFICIINPFKISSALATYPSKRQKKLLQPASIGGKVKDNTLLVWDTETHVQYRSIYLRPTGIPCKQNSSQYKGWGHAHGHCDCWVLIVQKHQHQQNEGYGATNSCRHIHQNESSIIYEEMTAGVTNWLLIMTPKWSSNFLDMFGNKQVVLQHMYLGAKVMPEFSSKIS